MHTWLDNNRIMVSPLIWNNSDIRWHNSPLFIQDWVENGFVYVKDLFPRGCSISFEQLKTKISDRGNLLIQYSAVSNALQHCDTLTTIKEQEGGIIKFMWARNWEVLEAEIFEECYNNKLQPYHVLRGFGKENIVTSFLHKNVVNALRK